MKTLILILSTLILASCGKSGSGGNAATPTPAKPAGKVIWNQSQLLTVSRLPDNSETLQTWVIPNDGKLTIPDASQFIAIANASNPWVVSISVAGHNCDWGFTVPVFVVGVCPDYARGFIPVSAGDVVSVRISTAITQRTEVSVLLTGSNL